MGCGVPQTCVSGGMRRSIARRRPAVARSRLRTSKPLNEPPLSLCLSPPPRLPQAPDRYARRVAGGYRPPRTEAFDDGVWALIEACWAQDPLDRPTAAEVVAILEALLEKCAAGGGAPAAKESCSIM